MTRRRPTRVVRRYGSLGEFIRAAETNQEGGASQRDGDGGWAGTATFAEALKLAREGWTESRGLVDNLTAPLVSQIRDAIVPAVEYAPHFAGGAVNMGRYLAGDPRCMMQARMTERPASRRVTRILTSFTTESRVTPDAIIRRGVAVVALTELLGMANRAVEIYVERTFDNLQGQVETQLIQVKQANEPMDVNAVMFAMAHPSMLRRLGFAESGDRTGAPQPLAMRDEVGADVAMETQTPAESWDVPHAVRWIKQQLRDAGVTLDEGGRK